jgi:catechol 2,3-dioxygenase-like lactoylglutathione lyase family enzyme
MKGLAAVATILLLATPALAGPAVRAVEAVGLTVSDAERSSRWYADVLGFATVSDVEVAGDAYERLEGVFGLRMRVVRLRLGDEALELTEYLAPRGRPAPPDARSNDRWFQHVAIVVSDIDEAYRRLRGHHVEHVSAGPQRLPDWNPNAGGIRAFYFRDPDGHPLELIQFPPGKGDPRWQRAEGRIFLGIDHTAIAVADTDASLAFYRDALGLRVAGESENWGPEQERLNAVFGARLRITSLRAARGPGIELLEYLAPRDGRPFPADERANDLVHWQTRLAADDVDAAERTLRAGGRRLVSPGTIALPDATLGFARGVGVRDPDGHVVELVAGAQR